MISFTTLQLPPAPWSWICWMGLSPPSSTQLRTTRQSFCDISASPRCGPSTPPGPHQGVRHRTRPGPLRPETVHDPVASPFPAMHPRGREIPAPGGNEGPAATTCRQLTSPRVIQSDHTIQPGNTGQGLSAVLMSQRYKLTCAKAMFLGTKKVCRESFQRTRSSRGIRRRIAVTMAVPARR